MLPTQNVISTVTCGDAAINETASMVICRQNLKIIETQRRCWHHMKKRQINLFLHLVQGAGAVFVAVFSAAHLFALPSMDILHGEPVFKLLLSTFGAIFLILIVASVILAISTKSEKD